jgi:hypothetical protein
MVRRGRTWVVPAVGATVVAVVALAVATAPPGGAPSATAVPATPSPAPAASPSPAALTSAPSASVAPTTTAAPEIPVIWLLDVRADRAVRLIEASGSVLHAAFDRTRPEVLVGTSTEGPTEMRALYRFDLSGKQIERGEWPPRGIVGDFARCVEIRSVYEGGPGGPPPIVEVDGKRFENVNCGAISPDGRLMTYWLWAEGASRGAFPLHIDQWSIDLTTGERRLLKNGLAHCGGCDSVPSPKWSPTSRYVYFSDVVAGGNRFFLADVRTGEVRPLADHIPREAFDVPAWSPVDDILIRSSGGRALLERVPERKVGMIGDWPARFDPTGRYLYSPAWAGPDRPSQRTSIFEVATGALVAEHPGVPEKRTYLGIGGPPLDVSPVVASAGGVIAALQDAPGCAGTTIYGAQRTCVAGASAPELSPDGSKVALVRATGGVVTTQKCRSCFVVEIVVVDTASGREIAASSRSIRLPVESEVRRGVRHSWNKEGTHLVVSPAR